MEIGKYASSDKRLLNGVIKDQEVYLPENERLTEHDFDHYNRTALSLHESEERYNAFRARLRNIILVDIDGSRLAGIYYQDIEKEAIQEKARLEEEASVSGIKKVFTDITGSKKKEAQRRLDRLEEQKQILQEERARRNQAYRRGLQASFESQGWKDECRKVDEEYAEAMQKVEEIRKIPKEQWTTEQDLFVTAMMRYPDATISEKKVMLFNASKYARTIREVSDSYFKNPDLSRKVDTNKVYRDTARWASRVGEADKISPEAYKNKISDLTIVLKNGIDVNGEKVSNERFSEAVNSIFESFDQAYDSYKEQVRLHPSAFEGSGDSATMLANFDIVQEIFKSAQSLNDITKLILKSKIMGKFTEEQRNKVKDRFMYFDAMHYYTKDYVSMAHKMTKFYKENCSEDLDEIYKPTSIPSFSEYLKTTTPYV